LKPKKDLSQTGFWSTNTRVGCNRPINWQKCKPVLAFEKDRRLQN
jgi:hypothetical protein